MLFCNLEAEKKMMILCKVNTIIVKNIIARYNNLNRIIVWKNKKKECLLFYSRFMKEHLLHLHFTSRGYINIETLATKMQGKLHLIIPKTKTG